MVFYISANAPSPTLIMSVEKGLSLQVAILNGELSVIPWS